ncbi:MAG: PEGA domain-containing protein [Deltaproteobacteria bacterium]|nr:PEGA domain-containing protein [Deltaproteobacteria bacterium]
MTWPARLALVGILGALAPPARADDGSPPAHVDTGFEGKATIELEIDRCPPPPQVDGGKMREIADEHYRRGAVLYSQGDYDGAIAEFAASYCLLPHYKVLKAISLAHERLLRFEQAVRYLERYVLEVPDDVRGATENKQTMSARIQVLRNLPAQVQVASSPPGARVTFENDQGLRGEGKADDKLIELLAGHYTMTTTAPGYEPQRREVDIGIGKPYSFVVTLARQRGKVHILTVPGDARIFIDNRLVSLGAWDDELDVGTYTVEVESAGRVSDRRRIEVAPGGDLAVTVELVPQPTSGRRLLVAAGTAAGAIAGASVGTAVDASESKGPIAGGMIGAAVGFLGSYFGAPDDISSGTSSYILTSSLIGYVEGIAGATLFSDRVATSSSVGAAGLLSGAIFSSVTARSFNFDAGEAALLNSGALWGGATGGLFAVIFGLPHKLSGGIVLGGLNAGVVAGALLGRRYKISRRHAALVDLAGLGGMAVSVAFESGIDHKADTPKERVAHFALGGMAIGLIAGVVLTRRMDEPRTPKLAPRALTIRDAAGNGVVGIGVGGDF